MANLNEIIDSLNDENISDEDKSQLMTDLKTEASALHDGNKKLYSRAKKAEGFEFKDDKWVKKPEPVVTPEPPKDPPKEPEQPPQLDEPDYAKLAFLEGKGVKHPDDQKIVQDEATRLKLPLTDVLEMKHIQAKLKDSKDQREAEDGMPSGDGKPSGSNKTSVDYWVGKKNKDGSFATPDDLELAEKVIKARIKSEESGNKFSETLFRGDI